MKKVSVKKLSLSKETVSRLTNSEINNVLGGGHRRTKQNYCTTVGLTCVVSVCCFNGTVTC